MSQRVCNVCGVVYEDDEVLAFFRVGTACTRHQSYSACKGCRRTRDDLKKKKNRARKKAESTLRRHTSWYNKRNGTNLTPKRFAEKFGWNIDRMTHDIWHAYENSCEECGGSYKEMDQGLASVTLDIITPENPPVYGTNTRWICATDNREKQNTPRHLHIAKKQAWIKWSNNQRGLAVPRQLKLAGM